MLADLNIVVELSTLPSLFLLYVHEDEFTCVRWGLGLDAFSMESMDLESILGVCRRKDARPKLEGSPR